MSVKRGLMVSALALGVAAPAWAQSDSLKKMMNVQATGASFEDVMIPQTGKKADQIRKNLEGGRSSSRPGSRSTCTRSCPTPGTWRWGHRVRPCSLAPASPMSTRSSTGTRIASPMTFSPSRRPSILKVPNGVCFSKDGFLFVVEANQVLTLPGAEFFHENPDVAVGAVVEQGKLIPPEFVSFNHGARVCRIGPDNKLYIALGQPHNVPPPDKQKVYKGIGHRRHHPNGPRRQEPGDLR